MGSQNYGLGRGLASLIPQKSKRDEKDGFVSRKISYNEKEDFPIGKNEGGGDHLLEVDIEKIIENPYQPRHRFDEVKLDELSRSISKHGIIQPLVVTQNGNQFELIAGERRLQASKKAGLKKIPVIVKKIKEKEKLEMAIIENVQRHNLNPMEEAKAYQQLIDDFEMSQEDVAEKMGKSRSLVANKLRLLNLQVDAKKAVIEGKISEGHAKVILSVDDIEKQRVLLEFILKNKLSVRQAEGKTKEISVKSHTRLLNVDPEVSSLENRLTEKFGTKVKVKKAGKEGGRIIIDFYSKDDLEGIMKKVN